MVVLSRIIHFGSRILLTIDSSNVGSWTKIYARCSWWHITPHDQPALQVLSKLCPPTNLVCAISKALPYVTVIDNNPEHIPV